MSGQWQDQQLREHFQELRRDETGSAPSFSVTCAAAYAKNRDFGRAMLKWRLAAVAAVALLLVVASVFLLQRPWPRGSEEAKMASLSDWRSPTEWLLQTPGRQLLKSVPKLGEPLMRFESAPMEGKTK
jgi:hypothetical protein